LLSISRVLSLLSPNPTTPQTAPTLLRRRGGAVLTLLRRTPTHHPNKKEKWWWLRAWRGFGRGVPFSPFWFGGGGRLVCVVYPPRSELVY